MVKIREQQSLKDKKNPLRNHNTDEEYSSNIPPPFHTSVLLKVQLYHLKLLVNIQLIRNSMPRKDSKKTIWKEYDQIPQQIAPPAAILDNEN